MFDLFAPTPAPARPVPPAASPAPASPSPTIQHNDSYVELAPEKRSDAARGGATPSPKKFSRAFGDLHPATNTTKIEPENSQKNTNSENQSEDCAKNNNCGKPENQPKDHVTDRGLRYGEGRKVRVEERRANHIRVMQGNPDDPLPHDEWVAHPEWHERRAPPLRRGYRNQRENVESILAQVETPKPELPASLAEAEPETVVDCLIAFVEAGGTQTEFCRRAGISSYKLGRALDATPGGRERFDTARRTTGADALAEEALRIATEPLMTEESIETYDKDDELVSRSVKRADNVYARKLAYQARMTLLQKWAPERYGENVKPAVGDGMAERLRKARDRLMGEFYSARRELALPPRATQCPGSRGFDLPDPDK